MAWAPHETSDKVTKKIRNFSISNSWLRQFEKDARACSSYFGSDRRPVVTKLTTPTNKIARFYSHKPQKPPRLKMKVREEFCDKQVDALNFDQNRNHNIILFFLAESCEIIPRIFRRKNILQWDDNPHLKRLIEKNKQKIFCIIIKSNETNKDSFQNYKTNLQTFITCRHLLSLNVMCWVMRLI